MPEFSKYLEEPFPKTLSINTGAKHSFKSYSALNTWVEEERSFLQGLNFAGLGGNGNQLNQFVNEIQSFFRNHNQQNWSDEEFFLQFKQHLESMHKAYGLIDSKSKEGKWLISLKSEDPSKLNGAVQYFITKRRGNINNEQIGQLHAYMFDRNIVPNFEAEKQQYNTYFDELDEAKTLLIDELSDKNEKQKTQIEEFEVLLETWMGKFKGLNDSHEKAHKALIEKHGANMKEKEDFYEKKLAVKSAVTYWTTKAHGHLNSSKIFGFLSAALLIAAIFSTFRGVQLILTIPLDSPLYKRILTDNGALQIWVYGAFIISMALVIWLIRILVKIFFSNLHLQTDAKERATMIETYLAFEREEKTLSPEDKSLILPSIFRTSASGIVKEDGGPSTPLNVILKSPGS